MGDWTWGAAQAGAVNEGRLRGDIKYLQAEHEDALKSALMYQKAFHRLRDRYNSFYVNKAKEPRISGLDIYALVGVDKLQDASLPEKRRANLEIIAWEEYITIEYRDGDLICDKEAPKLKGLSQAIANGSIKGEAAARAVEDIANRIALATGLPVGPSPRPWVKERVDDMLTTVKWQKGADKFTFPVPSTLEGQKGKHPVIVDYEKTRGVFFDPIEHDWNGCRKYALRMIDDTETNFYRDLKSYK